MKATSQNKTDRNEITSLIYTIANVAHAEYHLCELMMVNYDAFPKQVDKLSQDLATLRSLRSDLMKTLASIRPAAGATHCIVKHLILSEFHLFELFEKTPDVDYMKKAKSIHLLLDSLLARDDLSKLKDCPRCDEDKNAKIHKRQN